jgi:hypothetical protein
MGGFRFVQNERESKIQLIKEQSIHWFKENIVMILSRVHIDCLYVHGLVGL